MDTHPFKQNITKPPVDATVAVAGLCVLLRGEADVFNARPHFSGSVMLASADIPGILGEVCANGS
ncbi:hypothetical protein ACW5W4_00855 [Aeromonas crassostreae]